MQPAAGWSDEAGSGDEAGAPLPVLTALVCELRAADEGVTDEVSATLRERIHDILGAHGAEVDPVQGNPDATAAVFGPDVGDADGTWRAVVAASDVRDAVAQAMDEVVVRVGVAASDVDRDPASLGLWRTHVVDVATGLQLTAAGDEVILNATAYGRVTGWVEAEVAQTGDPRGDTFRLLGVAPSISAPDAQPEIEPEIEPEVELEVPSSEFEPDLSLDADPWAGLEAAHAAEAVDADEIDSGEVTEPEAAFEPETRSAPEAVTETDEEIAEEIEEDIGDPARDGAQEPAWRLVGRDVELEELRSAYAEVHETGRPSVVSLHGPDGIGKTALVATFAAGLDGPSVIPLDCPPLELGGATRPLVSLIETLAGVDATSDTDAVRDAIRPLLADDAHADADRLASLLTADGHALATEVRPALERLLAASARHAPVVLVADEASNLTRGTVGTLVELVRDGGVAVLAVIVHEGRVPLRADREVAVRPLAPDAIAEIADAMVGHGGLASEARDAIIATSQGNPLAAQQIVAMLLDDGFLRWEYGRWVGTVDLNTLSLPTDVRALVDARIDRLDAADRDLLAAAAAFGDTFPVAGVASDDDADARIRLDALAERRFLALIDDSHAAFAHPSIRRTAAGADAQTHHRAATWLAAAGHGRGPAGAELIGSRLAVAARSTGDTTLARQAAASLLKAAEGAAALGDDDASLDLLRAATALLPPDDATRTDLLLETGLRIARRGDAFAAERAFAQAALAARTADDAAGEARANVLRTSVRTTVGAREQALEALRDAADAATALCEPANDDTGLAWAWSAWATLYRHRGHFAAAADAAERAAAHARAAGRRVEEVAALLDAGRAVIDGPAPVAKARERCEAIAARLRGSAPAEHELDAIAAVLLARERRLDDARERGDAAVAAAEGSPDRAALARCLWLRAQVEILAGLEQAAEPFLGRSIDAGRDGRDAATRARAAATLANVLVDLGTTNGVDALVALARDVAARDDVFAQVAWRCARAKQRAREGRGVEARALVRTAVRIADQTDLVELRAGTLLDHAEVMRLLGRPNEALPSARKALRSLERRGAPALADRARAMIDLLEGRRAEPRPESAHGEAAGSSEPEAAAGLFADVAGASEGASREWSANDPAVDTGQPQDASSTGVTTPEGDPSSSEPEQRERRWFW